MPAPSVGVGRVEAGLVGVACLHGVGEGVVYLEDDAFVAVVAVELGLVLALHDGEGVQDVGHGGAGRGERLGQGGGLLTPPWPTGAIQRRRLGFRAEVEVEAGGGNLLALIIKLATARDSRRRFRIEHLRSLAHGVHRYEVSAEKLEQFESVVFDGDIRATVHLHRRNQRGPPKGRLVSVNNSQLASGS